MWHNTGSMVTVLIVAGLQLSACSKSEPGALDKGDKAPAKVEHIDGTEISRVILSPKAAERLDIQTAPVREVQVTRSGAVRQVQLSGGGALRKVVPYAAVLYDAHGKTWVYTSPEPLVFARYQIVVDHIAGDQAVLSEGPPVGTLVVTVGGAELFGAEFEIGH